MEPIEDDDNKENVDQQPMPLSGYIPGTTALLEFGGTTVRDRGIIDFQRHRHFRGIRRRITLLTRYMQDVPFPGDAVIPDLQSYYGRDYNSHVLEEWLAINETARTYCAPMTHEQYLVMRTAKLTMMRAMLIAIPGNDDYYPPLWYTFSTMGELLDSLTTWPHSLTGQMAAANDFFNNPQWLPIEIDLEPFPILAIR